MTLKNVAHFLRKSTQLKASFIQNQICKHIEYNPNIVYKFESHDDDAGYAKFNNNSIPILSLWDKDNLMSGLLYKYPKLISRADKGKILDFIEHQKIKVAHFHYGTDAGIYYPFLKISPIPTVVSFYGYDSASFHRILFGYGRHYLNVRVFPYATKILAMSPDMKKDLVAIGCPEEKIVIHYYGTDIKKFLVKRPYDINGSIHFLIISELKPKKGHLFLLKAFKEAYKVNNNLKLKIIGSGPVKEEINAFMKENDMHYVELRGKIEYGSQEHLNELNNADIFINPSVTDKDGDKEGIPGTLIEAMAAGIPVISTHHAGIPDIIANNATGLLVKEWDIAGLKNAILLLASDPKKRMNLGIQGQEYSRNNLDLDVKERELETLYDNIINSNKCQQ